MKKSEEGKGEGVTVKLSGKTLATVIALKHKLERDRETIVSVVEVIREAVNMMARNWNVYEEEKGGGSDND